MCGIHLQVWQNSSCLVCKERFSNDNGNKNLRRRGPDACYSVSLTDNNDNYSKQYYKIYLEASVLQMRQELIKQPVCLFDNRSDYFCWNGEVYQMIEEKEDENENKEQVERQGENENSYTDVWNYETSDTLLVANQLRRMSSFVPSKEKQEETKNNNDEEEQKQQAEAIGDIMGRLYNAEFAFLILTPTCVYYGRDSWGRRSLLRWDCPNENCTSFQIVSTAEELYHENNCNSDNTNSNKDKSQKIDDMNNSEQHQQKEHYASEGKQQWAEILPGMVHYESFSSSQSSSSSSSCANITACTSKVGNSSNSSSNSISNQINKRENNDNNKTTYFPFTVPYSKNISYNFPRIADSVFSAPYDNNFPPPPEGISNQLWLSSMKLEYYLTEAISMRLDNITERSTGILFSGGLDSSVIAALAAKIVSSSNNGNDKHHPLILYNVSFGPTHEKSADRQAALITYQALQEQYDSDNNNDNRSGDNIIYKDIIVEWDDICKYEPHIRTLLQPKTTLMDVNIATALWFASRGIEKDEANAETQASEDGGQLENDMGKEGWHQNATNTGTKQITNKNAPRVLLLGMGADELLGGYGRHRKAYEKGGTLLLEKELIIDQNRFWERNLGRDDRICSDHNKECRFPFLDTHVVEFIKSLSTDTICNFNLPPGQGDKLILRLIAYRLGIKHSSTLVKRAIQFGSRISHLSDKKRFGSRRKAKGESTV